MVTGVQSLVDVLATGVTAADDGLQCASAERVVGEGIEIYCAFAIKATARGVHRPVIKPSAYSQPGAVQRKGCAELIIGVQGLVDVLEDEEDQEDGQENGGGSSEFDLRTNPNPDW